MGIEAKDVAPGAQDPEVGVPAEAPRDEEDFIDGWLKEVSDALDREKAFRGDGDKLIKIYEARDDTQNSYNILFSNTDTLAPALYNVTPRPVVKARFQNKDNALQRLASMTSERILKYLLDPNNPEYASFDTVMRKGVLNALVPGRGALRVKYDAEITEAEKEGDPATVDYEAVCLKHVSWCRYLEGYAESWEEVPWIAYEHQMTKEELEANFGASAAGVTPVEMASEGEAAEKGVSRAMFGSRAKESAKVKLATVFEIWYKAAKKVYFISPQSPQSILKEVVDPLDLEGFWPMPEPLELMQRVSGRIPVPLYNLYKTQATELNDISARITRLVRALRIRGFYDSTVQGLDKLLTSPDNTMTPISNAAQLGAQGISLDKALFIIPIDMIVAALQSLYAQRQQCKAVIFEITGIADIMRGSSSASETLGAQEIKNQWGTLRLKRMQKEVARFARDTLRIMLEIAVNKLSQKTIRAMTGLPFPTAQEKAEAQAQLQAMAVPSQPLMPGAMPAPPPEPDPQLQAVAMSPSWEDILSLLKSDSMRQFAVDVETNSTVDAEATEDKQDMAELMNALAQFMNGVAPMVESGALPFEASKALMINLLRRFRMGGEVEEALMAMQPPKPQGADPEAQKALEKAQQQLQQDQQALTEAQAQFKLQQAEAQSQLKLQQQEATMQQEFAKKELAMIQKFNEQSLQLEAKQRQQAADMRAREQEFAISSAAQTAQHQVGMAQDKATSVIQQSQDKADAAAAKPKPAPKGD